MAYKFQKGAAIMSGALAQEGTLEVMDDAGGLQGQMTSAGVVSGSGNFQGGGTATFASSVTAGTSFIIGSADLNETDMEKLDGITNGTAAANKAVVLDGSKNIATIGTIGCGVITSTGTSIFGGLDISGDIDVDGTTNLDAVDIDGAVQVDSTITVGVDDTGYDVKFFGDTASAYMLWDTSADALTLAGTAGLIVPDGKLTLNATAVTSTATELNYLDGTILGTAVANKVLAVDANKDLGTLRNLTLSGELDAATGDFSGNIDVDGIANLDVVDIDGATQIDATVTVGVDDTGYDVKFFGDTASAYMLWDTSADDLILAGAAGLSVAGQSTFDGAISPAGVAAAGIAVGDDSMFFLDSDGLMKKTTQVLYAAALVASEPGFASSGGKLQFDPNSLDAVTPATGDAIVFTDATDTNIPKKATFDAFAGVLAGGTGISASGVALSLDLNELGTGANINVAADSIAFIDADDDASYKDSIVDLVAGMAGAGLTASAGQLSAAGSGDSISVASVANAGTMAAGLNYTATQTGAIAVALPAVALAQDGDIIYLKGNSGTSSTNKITVSCDTGDKIDGVTNGTVIVESPFASVGFVYVHATTNWSLI